MYKTKGIVIKENPYKENDKLVTILTEKDGLITVNVKGARKITASHLKSVQLFTYSNFCLYCKNDYYTLVECELINGFYALRNDIKTLALASYFCEGAGAVSTKSEDGEWILKLLLNTLYVLEHNMYTPEHIKATFELRLCKLLGLDPELKICPTCGCPLEMAVKKVFAIDDGAVFCESCNNGTPISHSVFLAVCYIVSVMDNRIFSYKLDDKSLFELSRTAEMYFLTQTELKLNTLNFYKNLGTL